MNEIIRGIVYSLGGAIIGGFFNVWLQRVKNQGSNEGVYAEHSEDLFKRLDKITDERDDLKEQVFKLRNQISNQSKVIDQLTRKVDLLSNQFDNMEANRIEK